MALIGPPPWKTRLRDGPIPPWLLALILVACIVTPGMWRLQQLNEANKHALKVACTNANETREADIQLWTFVLRASAANPQNQNPQQAKVRELFEDYVNDLYRPHDCNDLTKVYKFPPQPRLPDGTSQAQ